MSIDWTRIPGSQVGGLYFPIPLAPRQDQLMAFGAPNHLVQAGIYSTILSREDDSARKMYLALRMAGIGGAWRPASHVAAV